MGCVWRRGSGEVRGVEEGGWERGKREGKGKGRGKEGDRVERGRHTAQQ